MARNIELDVKRVALYNQVKDASQSIAMHQEYINKLNDQVNIWMDELKAYVDDPLVVEFTAEDFDTVLKLRDDTLVPVFEVKIEPKVFDFYNPDLGTAVIIDKIAQDVVVK